MCCAPGPVFCCVKVIFDMKGIWHSSPANSTGKLRDTKPETLKPASGQKIAMGAISMMAPCIMEGARLRV